MSSDPVGIALSTFRILPILAACAVATSGCAETFYGQCAEPAHARLVAEPQALSATGLFAEARRAPSEELAPGVVEYRPRFELWGDGATNATVGVFAARRSDRHAGHGRLAVPRRDEALEGVHARWRGRRDSTPPQGRTGCVGLGRSRVRVEQRGNDAVAAPDGIDDARGTPHDVPPARKCMGCHGGTPSRVLGFSAIQLAREASDDPMSLPRLVREGRLTRPPPTSLRVPGDSATQQALGYLHANCSHCHNQQRPPSARATVLRSAHGLRSVPTGRLADDAREHAGPCDDGRPDRDTGRR